jgi:hypothetical protein
MKRGTAVLLATGLSMFPKIALAAGDSDSNVWTDFLFSWGPILLLIVVWLLYMRNYRVRGGMKTYVKRLYEYMDRTEELLERIAQAVEKGQQQESSGQPRDRGE